LEPPVVSLGSFVGARIPEKNILMNDQSSATKLYRTTFLDGALEAS
jgi:hypothetical protein